MFAIRKTCLQWVGGIDPLLLRIILISLSLKLILLGVIVMRMGEVGLVTIVDDGTTYQQIAQNILDGNGYSMVTTPPFVPDAIRAPIIPYLMSLSLGIFGSLIPFVLIGILASLLQIYALWHIIRLLGGGRTTRMWGALLIAFEPAGLMLSVLAISEPLFVSFFLCAVYVMILMYQEGATWNRSLLLGLLLGLSAMTRPIGLYVIPLVLIWLFLFRPRAWKYILVVGCVSALLVAPWFIRNTQTFGVTSFSSGGIQNLYFHFGSTLLSLRDGVSVNETNIAQYEEAVRLSGLSMREVEQQDLRLNSLLREKAFALVLENPQAAWKTLLYTQFAFFTNDSYRFYYLNRLFGMSYDKVFNPTLEMFQDPIGTFPKLFKHMREEYFLSFLGRAFFALTSMLGVCGLFILIYKRETRAIGLLLLLVLAYFAAASATGGHGITMRYRYPIQGILYVGTLFAVEYLLTHYRSHSRT